MSKQQQGYNSVPQIIINPLRMIELRHVCIGIRPSWADIFDRKWCFEVTSLIYAALDGAPSLLLFQSISCYGCKQYLQDSALQPKGPVSHFRIIESLSFRLYR
jgi:hypothetical protein